MPFFSVIIPTYNRLPYLLEALESVARQSFRDYEVIVVDDGSTDGTAKEVERIIADGGWRIAEGGGRKAKNGKLKADRDGDDQSDLDAGPSSLDCPRIRVLRQENAGPGAARNLGASVSRGEYLAFLDSDDLWFPWTLETYYKAIRSNNEVSFVAGREIKVCAGERLDGVLIGLDCQKPAENCQFRFFPNYLETSSERIWIGTPAACIRRSSFEEVGGFLTKRMNAEDSDLWLRLGTQRGFVRIDEPAVFAHRLTPGSEVASGTKAVAGMKNLLLQEKAGKYPGGCVYRWNRMKILSRHLRPGCVGLVKDGRIFDALVIYICSFKVNLQLKNWKFLTGLLGLALWSAVKKIIK